MIVGIGNDIIEIERIEKAILKEGFKNKVYTERELENIEKRGNRTETYAGIFSAKEAISKAIGTGVREFSLIDLEILNDDLGKPYVVVSEKLDKILKNTSSDKRKLINQMLKYPENSAGSVMTVEYISFKDNYTVKQAIEYYRKVAIDKEETDICFVTDTKKKLVGIISLKTLILSKDDSYIQDEMDTNFVSVLTLDDQEEIAALFRKYDLTTMPVVDHEDRLVGVITVDDIVDVIDQENTEDIQKMAAMNPSDEEYLKESVVSLAKHRILWLLVLMISATFTGLVIKKYEDILQSAVYLATFIPMLMDTGGNAGSQSATLVIRGIALEEIEFSDIFRVIWKELRVSILVGFILSAVNFIRIYYFTRSGLETSLVVAISMFLTVIMAKVIGGVLPLVAKSLKIDPAIMASPLITTIVDTAALIIFFKLSVIFLHI